MLSSGTLHSAPQLLWIIEAVGESLQTMVSPVGAFVSNVFAGVPTVVPVALPGFHFPTEAYYQQTFPQVLAGGAKYVAQQVRKLFTTIAVTASMGFSDA